VFLYSVYLQFRVQLDATCPGNAEEIAAWQRSFSETAEF